MRLFTLLLVVSALGCRSKGEPVDTGTVGASGPVDADGDGYAEDVDCDDADASVHPDGAEICDGLDNDCDGEVDEDVLQTYYMDGDGDGYGDQAVQACAQPSGAVAVDGDCDDADADTWPGAAERCDGIDNDCDGDVDEDVLTTWYSDSDGDGFGDAGAPLDACDPPSGYVADATDCDDTSDVVWPGAEEVCDELDNNCDGDVDEGVTATWYVDADGDGYGDPSLTTEACSMPYGYSGDPGDCDDADATVSPAATEVCDGADNDCDGTVDEDDAADAATWYVDADGDGYGDESSTTAACSQPSGYSADLGDCDDADATVSPAATEVCDEVDNDCDGTVDEDDAADADTWYIDYDGDGYGSDAYTQVSCEQPSGYVDNADDCDDADATDTDADGTQDCADDDIDGDGLRNDWDADAYDDGVVRGPTAGLGGDGALTVSSDDTFQDWTLLDGGATAGDASLVVDDASAFAADDEVLVLSQQGDDAGVYQMVFVTAVSGTTLDIEPVLTEDFDADSVVLVQRVPHYTDVDIASGASLSADAWAGAGGGVLVFRATGDVTIDGDITVGGLGFEGGAGVYGNSYDPYQGESYGGAGAAGSAGANDGGGGAYPRRGDHGDSGGGGGYGVQGDDGTDYSANHVTNGGNTYGDSELSTWFLGSGGGGGSPDTEGDGSGSTCYAGDGGDGGGLVAIFAGGTITVAGSVDADGVDGDDAYSPSSSQGEVGGGGGGSGGQVYLAAPTLDLTGTVSAEGGEGGLSDSYNISTPYGSAIGGDGGAGRVRLDYDTLSGSPTTAAGYEGAWEE